MYTPKYVVKEFNNLDFIKLYEAGYKIIISDLDNTLAPYTDSNPTNILKEDIKKIKEIGFKIYLISNNNKDRIARFSEELNVDGYLANANKPNPEKLKKYLSKLDLLNQPIIALGDQLVTDILCFNRLNLYSVLVKTIDSKTQKWYTKLNRLREKNILKKIKDKNPEIYRKIEEIYE